MKNELIELLARRLEDAIGELPKQLEGLYDTCAFVRTGTNLCHPITWGLLTKIVASLPSVAYVGIDVRLNAGGGLKFQPDVVGFQQNGTAVVYADFESPNSSDARIAPKDVSPYLAWTRQTGDKTPYLIVTSLPDCNTPDWELRWTNSGQYNETHRGKREEIRANPFRYWLAIWAEELRGSDLSSIALLNIDRRRVVQAVLIPPKLREPKSPSALSH